MDSRADSDLPPIVSLTAAELRQIESCAELRAAMRRRRWVLTLALAGYVLVPVGIAVAFCSQVGIHRSDAVRAMAPWQIAAGVLIILVGVGSVIAARILYRPTPIARRCRCGYSGLCQHERGEERVGSMPMTDFLCAAFSVGWNPICPQCGNHW
jgi:hypothetical protein